MEQSDKSTFRDFHDIFAWRVARTEDDDGDAYADVAEDADGGNGAQGVNTHGASVRGLQFIGSGPFRSDSCDTKEPSVETCGDGRVTASLWQTTPV